MFRSLSRPLSGFTAHYQNRRSLSYISFHSLFPTTSYRFQVQRESKLFDKRLEQDDWEWEDGVEIANDGLVHPKISLDGISFNIFWVMLLMTITVSNGALFMPNTHFMQEVTRRSFDNYLDAVDNGQLPASPHYLRVLKGTTISNYLTLYREQDSRFTLQPSYPMTLVALNDTLTEFYTKSCTSIAPEEWLESYPYNEAFFDNSEDWMAR
ncbi:hypothetical protein BGW36DRAFT_144475 [Talaromyces proteolyticus]|uniref:Tse2 ADP-ribosyltransferase toxin domain-containing protein n=1 Tax=Talaromyces proteolyticus TaxID=1131652 RepID=A0AAD4KW79_9EURO|nr:uncharacterized protein BGW36DRAFT_144475 [Talaromyces proteolyticus]KAH8698347.1 hypothetical protein BGW36DRAFT_144475 [Talaromyces proteolyticus]